MSRPVALELPTLQNWSCHSCSGCCRQHLIEITQEERQRIEQQHWTSDDGIPSDRPLLVRMGRNRYRLGHQADGACVFLDENGLCRIHAKFGEPAKPLACRLYPFTFHPAGRRVAVGVRFSCPSAVANRGRTLPERVAELKRFAGEVVPEGIASDTPPDIHPGQSVSWDDLARFLQTLDTTLEAPQVPVTLKLLRSLQWMRLVEQAQFGAVRGARLGELLQLLHQAAETELTEIPELPEPRKLGRSFFRLLAAQYARKDTLLDLDAGWRHRWQLLKAAWKFSRGRGQVPRMQTVFPDASFAALETPFGFPEDAEELMTRYFRVKIQSIHFCGRGFYGMPLVEGWYSLVLVFPVVLWLARWLAVGAGRDRLIVEDVERALSIADHHHGFSPAFGQRAFRNRVRFLARNEELERLVTWYSR